MAAAAAAAATVVYCPGEGMALFTVYTLANAEEDKRVAMITLTKNRRFIVGKF